MTIHLKDAVAALRKQMEDVVLRAAQQIPGFGFSTGHADGTWAIEVSPDGIVQNRGYAEENFGEYRNLSELNTWELGELVQVLEARYGKAG